MTREEFVAKWADEYIGRILRAFAMDHTQPLSARWLAAQVQDIDGWLGKLHDALSQEIKNAQDHQSRTGSKPSPASGSSAPPKAGPSRSPA